MSYIIERNDGGRLWRKRSTVFPSVRFKLHPENLFQKLKLLKTKIRCDEVHLMTFLIPSKIQLHLKANKTKPNKQTENLQNILQKFWWNSFWAGMGFPPFQAWIWWCNQRSISSVAKDCYLHWSLKTTNLGSDLISHIFSQWHTLGRK